MSVPAEDANIMAQRGFSAVSHIPGVTYVTYDANSQTFTIYVENASVQVPGVVLGRPARKQVSGPVRLMS